MEKLITKSFKRLLDKGVHRGFITYEELGKSLGKRHYSQENIEKAFLYIFDNKVSLVEKKSDFRLNKKRDASSSETEKNKDLHQYVKSKYLKSSVLIYKDDAKENYLIVCKNQTCSNKIKNINELKSVVENYAI